MRKSAVFVVLAALFFSLSGCTPIGAASTAREVNLAEMRPDYGILAESGNPVLELFARSHSARSFVEGEVAAESVELILAAGMKAGSARNAQPWHFTVVTNNEINSRLLSPSRPGNVVIVVSGDPGHFSQFPEIMPFDCGLASQNMMLAAESLGYGARMYISPVHEIERNWRDTLSIPEGNVVLMALLVGPTANPDVMTYATPRNDTSRHVNFVE